jgi:tetratricopeptide (TPR) repeat protein
MRIDDELGWPELPPKLLSDLKGWAGELTREEGEVLPFVVLTGDARWVGPAVTRGGLGVAGIRTIDMTATDESRDQTLASEVADLVSQVGGLGLSAIGLAVAPIVSVLGPFVPLSQRLLRRWRRQGQAKPDAMLRDSMRAIADEGPAVLFFGDLTSDDHQVDQDLLRYTIRHDTRRQLLGVCWASQPELLEPEREDIGGSRTRVVRRLEALDASGLQRWLGPMDRELALHVLAASGSDTWAASELWTAWTTSEHVQAVNGEYLIASKTPVMEDLRYRAVARFGGELVGGYRAIDLADEILSVASLTKASFSGTAIAHVVSEEHGVSVDLVEDLLDSLGDDPPVLTTSGARTQVGNRNWSYKWADPMLRRWICQAFGPTTRSAPTDRERIANRLVAAGSDLHGELEQFHRWRHELLLTAGRTEEAAATAEWIRHTHHRTSLITRATLMLAVDPTPELAEVFTSLCFELGQAGYPMIAIRVGEAAVASLGQESEIHTRAWAHVRLGAAFPKVLSAQALPHFDIGISSLRRLFGNNPDDPHYIGDLGMGLRELGVALNENGNSTDGIEALTESVALFRKLENSAPDDPRFTDRLAHGLVELGRAYLDDRNPNGAFETLAESVALIRKLHNSNPTNPRFTHNLAAILETLGNAYRNNGRPTDAIEALTESVVLTRELHNSDPTNPSYNRSLALGLAHLGNAHLGCEIPTDAIEMLTESVSLFRDLHNSDPTNPSHTGSLAFAIWALSKAHIADGAPADEIEALTESVALFRDLHNSNPTNPRFIRHLATSVEALGNAHENDGNAARGKALQVEAIALMRAAVAHRSGDKLWQADLDRLLSLSGEGC